MGCANFVRIEMIDHPLLPSAYLLFVFICFLLFIFFLFQFQAFPILLQPFGYKVVQWKKQTPLQILGPERPGCKS